ncbi:hypothetical protein BKA69DRAFT_1075668 [Paraphysoderma sedebokerense]|nr:hypothetical protein BKA69DRAFT_1075668 [Paraphysoderma sedebokerense]
MATCSVLAGQKIAIASCFAGVAISLVQKIYTSQDFYALKRNKFVFSAITLGSACCLIFYLAVMHGYINPAQYPGYITFWAFLLYSSCLYAVLIERTLPLIGASSGWSPLMRSLVRYGGPFVLALPQFISAIIWSHLYILIGNGIALRDFPLSALAAVKVSDVLVALGTFIMLLSNSILSYLFVYSLAQHRKQSLKIFIIENKAEFFNLLFNFVLACGFIIIKVIGTVFSTTAPAAEPYIFYLFHNLFNPIITLNTFGDYIFVTRKLSRELLSTGFDVNQKSVAAKSKSPTTGTRISDSK